MLQSSCGTDLTLAQIIAPLGGNINRLPCLLLPSGRRQKTERKLQPPQTNLLRASSRVSSLHDERLSKPKGSLRGWLNTALSAWKAPGSQSRRWCKLCGIPAITIYLQDILALLLLFSLSLEPIHRGTQRRFLENILSEDNLRSRIFGIFVLTDFYHKKIT